METVLSTCAPSEFLLPPIERTSFPADLRDALDRGFGLPWTIFEGESGQVLEIASDQESFDWASCAKFCAGAFERGRSFFFLETDPVIGLAIPIRRDSDKSWLAVRIFVVRSVASQDDFHSAAWALGLPERELKSWALGQSPWAADSLERIGAMVMSQIAAGQRIRSLESENKSLAHHINATYEEISMLHRLTENLTLAKSEEDLGVMSLEWLDEIVQADSIALQWLAREEGPAGTNHDIRRETILLTHGECPLNEVDFNRFVEYAGKVHARPGQPIVLNRTVTEQPEWPFPSVHEAILVPIEEGKNQFGWLAGFNRRKSGEFGTDEARMLNSVAVILGIHGGNISLYQQQADLMAGIIRALTAAIDAKDPYTCGHSDRVARLAVRLAQDLHCDLPTVNMIYLAGLLHDIGKIGIADEVLRKTGALTPKEYEHIKMHTEIGHRILRDIRKLDNILPVILHHHESWNGAGYPRQLHSEEIPFAARIVAVADSYDAMGSDRPYRKGMSEEKIEEIFRQGAGVQWDPDVVAAFFRLHDELHNIVGEQRVDLLPESEFLQRSDRQ